MRGQVKIGNSLFVFVVLGPGHPGAGRIKKIPLERNINSSLIEWDGDIVHIAKHDDRRRMGSRFLVEMCDEIGRPELFDAYAAWAQAGPEGRTLDVQEFPEDLLPPKVVEWRRQRAKASAQFDPRAMVAAAASAAPATTVALANGAPEPFTHAFTDEPGLVVEPAEARHPAPAPSSRPGRSAPRIPVTIPLPEDAGGA